MVPIRGARPDINGESIMPITISYDEWMRRTASRMRRRSEELKALDEAVRIRHEPAAKAAMIEWIKVHNRGGKDWHRSVRNSDGVVKVLYDQLGIMGSEVKYDNIGQEMDDKLAKAHIRREQRLAKQRLFEGKKLQFKSSFTGVVKRKSKGRVDTIKAAAMTTKNMAQKANEVRSIAKNIETIIQGLTNTLPPQEASEIITMVFGSSAAEFAKNAAPVVGAVTSGGKMVMDWVNVARIVAAQNDMQKREISIRKGDPAAAFQSILIILDRNLEKTTADAAIHTTAFAVKTAGVVADAGAATGTITGAVESLALLLNTLVDIVREALEMKAGNEKLRTGDLDVTIFEVCPILGCYYIATQDHSTIMDFDIENMGKDNWQLEAERLKVAIKPVIVKAGQLIAKSRVEIPGMENAKGVYQKSLKNKLVTFYKSKGYGQKAQDPDIISAVVKGEV